MLFILFAGPFNAVGWAFGWPSGGVSILTHAQINAFVILLPCTVLAMVMQDRMWRTGAFDTVQVFICTAIGLAIATLTGPLFFSGGAMLSGKITPDLFLTVLVASYGWGFWFGIVKAFALMVGVPCALWAVLVAYMCSSLVDPDAVDQQI